MNADVATPDESLRPAYTSPGRGWQGLIRPSVFTVPQAAAFLLLAFALIFLRTPRLILEGRIWAEEGTTYLHYAWNAPALSALLAPHQGYYSLWDNGLALLAARVLPLRMAALLFAWAALFVQLLTVYLVVSCSLASSVAARLLALLALLLTSATKEVWLNMENCQFWFPVCVALLLIGERSRLKPARLALLLLAGLTGVTSCMLTPLFWVKAAVVRTRSAFLEAGLLTATTAVQVVVIAASFHAGAREALRPLYAYLGPVLLQRVWVLSFLTTGTANAFGHWLARHPGGLVLGTLWMLFLLITVSALIFLFRVNWRLGALLGAGMLAAVLNWNGCYQCDFHLWNQSSIYDSRYFFEAVALLNLSMAYCATVARREGYRSLAGIAVAVLLLSGASQYMRSRAFFSVYPAWAPQVQAWEHDPSQVLQVAPAMASWRLILPHGHPELPIPAGIYDSTRVAGLDQ